MWARTPGWFMTSAERTCRIKSLHHFGLTADSGPRRLERASLEEPPSLHNQMARIGLREMKSARGAVIFSQNELVSTRLCARSPWPPRTNRRGTGGRRAALSNSGSAADADPRDYFFGNVATAQPGCGAGPVFLPPRRLACADR